MLNCGQVKDFYLFIYILILFSINCLNLYMTLDIFFLVRDCFNAGDGFAVADIIILVVLLSKWKPMPYFHNWLY